MTGCCAPTGRAAKLAEGKLTPEQIVEELYLAAHSRFPTAEEKKLAVAAFSADVLRRIDAAREVTIETTRRYGSARRRVVWVVVEGDAKLFNQYGVMLVNPARHPNVRAEPGQKFVDWLVGPEGSAFVARAPAAALDPDSSSERGGAGSRVSRRV